MNISPCVQLVFPDFEKHYQSGLTAKAYNFDSVDCREWHKKFVDKIFNAIDKKEFLPVFRMADGEFNLALGYPFGKPWYRRSIRQNLGIFYRFLLENGAYSKTGSKEYGYEIYTKDELKLSRLLYVNSIRDVSEKGILALALHDTSGFREYPSKIVNWFQENHICFDSSNYIHFYSVYVLLNGSDRHRLFNQKRILVVTGLTEGKQEGIEKGLLREGAADVQFLGVSPSKALFDVLDLSSVRLPVDLVLVGAGVGSANILVQLEPLQTACLDVGFCLSTIANPDLRWNRPLCIPDEEFDISRFPWISKGIKD